MPDQPKGEEDPLSPSVPARGDRRVRPRTSSPVAGKIANTAKNAVASRVSGGSTAGLSKAGKAGKQAPAGTPVAGKIANVAKNAVASKISGGNKTGLSKAGKQAPSGAPARGDRRERPRTSSPVAGNSAKNSAANTAKKAVASKIPIGNKTGLSKTGKVANVAKQAAAGAAGKNAGGKLAGGQLTGAAAGAAQGLLEVIPKKWILAIVLGPTAVSFIVWIVIISSITGLVGTNLSDQLASSNTASITLSGISHADLATIQSATSGTNAPWELLVAALYYESGDGETVAQVAGHCPAGARPGSVCPAVSDLQVAPSQGGTGGTGGSGSVSSQGTAPRSASTSGFNPAVGRNGTVPRLLAANSPDWTTTDTADWDCIREAESGDNYTDQSGAYGFLQSTWSYYNEPGSPGSASKAVQNALALKILNAEGHFYGAWNDACTGSGGETENPIPFISPGVANPSGAQGPTLSGGQTVSTTPSSGVIGGCASGAGPYCLGATALPATKATSLAASSTWIADRLSTAITSGNADGNLSDGTTLYSATEPPTLNTTTNYGASTNQSVIEAALAALPIAGNSSTLDANIYEMAIDLSVGYAPSSANGGGACTPNTPITGTTTIPGPPNGQTQTAVILSVSQTALAQEIVSDAGGASLIDVEAALTASLGTTQLSNATGVFGNGNTAVAAAVSAFMASAQSDSGSPADIAGEVLGIPSQQFTGWITGATTLATADTKSQASCSSGGSIPVVPGGSPQAQAAVKAAEAELGRPYIWGGGGTNGPSGSASPCANGVVIGTQVGAGNVCTAAYATQTGQPGFDCSGLVQYAYGQAGIALPRTSEAQYAWVSQHSSLTTQVSQLEPGDLLFYSFTGVADHVAIYLGDNKLIQAPETGEDVQIVPFYSSGFAGGGPV